MAVKRSEWVQKVKGEPSGTTQLVVVNGYIGDSPQPDHVRIYFDSRLSRFVDVPETAVRHQEDIANSNPPGAQRIWLDPDAEIKIAPQTTTAKFLDGNVARTYAARVRTQQTARGAAQGNLDEPTPWFTELGTNCPPRTVQFIDCPPPFTLVAQTSICCPFSWLQPICTEFDPFCPKVEFTNQSVCCTVNPLDCLSQLAATCDPRGICISEVATDCTFGIGCPMITEFTECVCPQTLIDPECGGPQPDTILQTDPLQFNRMAQLQRARRRAIGRRGLSRF